MGRGGGGGGGGGETEYMCKSKIVRERGEYEPKVEKNELRVELWNNFLEQSSPPTALLQGPSADIA